MNPKLIETSPAGPGHLRVTSNLPEADTTVSIVLHFADAIILTAELEHQIHLAQLSAAGWAEGDIVKKLRGTKTYRVERARPSKHQVTETEFEFWEVYITDTENSYIGAWVDADNLEKVNP